MLGIRANSRPARASRARTHPGLPPIRMMSTSIWVALTVKRAPTETAPYSSRVYSSIFLMMLCFSFDMPLANLLQSTVASSCAERE